MGRSLELLVQTLERVLANQPDVDVVSPAKLRDVTTGQLREHDVTVTVKSAHHSMVVALECKDLSRPVGVPQLEAFNRKCQDTSINHGILVSSVGFCRTALRKAEHLNMRCLLLRDIEDFDWFSCGSMPHTTWHLKSAKITFQPQVFLPQKPKNYKIFSPEGTTVDESMMKSLIIDRFMANPSLISESGDSSHDFKLALPGF